MQESPEPSADELRQRLYRPDATDEDRRRYAAAVAALPVESGPPVDAGPPAEPGHRRRRRALPVVVGSAVVLAVAGTGAVLAIAGSPAWLAGRGTAEATTPPGHVVGRPAPLAVSVDGTAAVAQVFHGVGAVAVPLDVSGAAHDGRIRVTLSPGSHFPLAWHAVRTVRRSDGSTAEVVVARSADALHQSVEVPVVAGYRGRPPTRIRVEAASDTQWTLVVAFAPGQAADLH